MTSVPSTRQGVKAYGGPAPELWHCPEFPPVRPYDRYVPEPGWYNDDADPLLARWHDGEQWTDYTVVKSEWSGIEMPPNPVGQRPLREYRPLPRRRWLRPAWIAGLTVLVATVLVVVMR